MSYRAIVKKGEYKVEFLLVDAENWTEAEEKVRREYPDWEITSLEKSETKIIT